MSATRYAVLAAMPAEFDTLRRLGDRFLTRCTGVGPQAAADTARALLSDSSISGLVSWGTCGGLDPSLAGGTLVVLSRVTSRESGVTHSCAPQLSQQLATLFKPVRAVVRAGISSTQAIASAADKAALRQTHQASVVDMESAALAEVAAEARVPFLAVRAVVDPAQCTLPASALAALEDPAHPTRAVLRALRQHPGDLLALIRLGLWHQRAIRALRGAALMMEYAPDFPPAAGPRA